MRPFVDTHCHVFQYRDPDAVLASLATTKSCGRDDRGALGLRAPAHARAQPCACGWRSASTHCWCIAPAAGVGAVSPLPRNDVLYRRGRARLLQRGARHPRPLQEAAFRKMLAAVAGRAKLLSLHSRGAEAAVLEQLRRAAVGPCIWHWYTGSLTTLDALLAQGHTVSINPAMLQSTRGKQVVARVPPEQTLVETDGPYVRIAGQPAAPADVWRVYDYLAQLWQEPLPAVRERVYGTFRALLSRSDVD